MPAIFATFFREICPRLSHVCSQNASLEKIRSLIKQFCRQPRRCDLRIGIPANPGKAERAPLKERCLSAAHPTPSRAHYMTAVIIYHMMTLVSEIGCVNAFVAPLHIALRDRPAKADHRGSARPRQNHALGGLSIIYLFSIYYKKTSCRLPHPDRQPSRIPQPVSNRWPQAREEGIRSGTKTAPVIFPIKLTLVIFQGRERPSVSAPP